LIDYTLFFTEKVAILKFYLVQVEEKIFIFCPVNEKLDVGVILLIYGGAILRIWRLRRSYPHCLKN